MKKLISLSKLYFQVQQAVDAARQARGESPVVEMIDAAPITGPQVNLSCSVVLVALL